MKAFNELPTNDKYRLIGEFTRDAKARRILGLKYVDGKTNEEIVRDKYGDAYLDEHTERIRKRKLDVEGKRLNELFDKFEEFWAWEKGRSEREEANED